MNSRVHSKAKTRIGLIALSLSACAVCLFLDRVEGGGQASVAAGYDLSWHTIDAGGVIGGTGAAGVYELSGTIGQPDAGGPMLGSGFELTGGFWFGQPPGDCVFDGVVDLLDFSQFVDCTTGPGLPTTDSCQCQDADSDGDVDLHDFARLQSGFSGS